MTTSPTTCPQIFVGATFTVAPIVDVVRFWAHQLPPNAGVHALPYGPLAPELLRLAAGRTGAAAVCLLFIRPNDIAEHWTELRDAVSQVSQRLPTLVVHCPDEAAGKIGVLPSTVDQRDGRIFFAAYSVDQPFLGAADASVHLPYSFEGMAALATGAMRWADLMMRPPIKLIATDADNTLWDGVIGEDGARGVGLSAGRVSLQQCFHEATAAGQILSVLSKNEEADVRHTFQTRHDFPLTAKDILDWRVGWHPKHQGLAEAAEKFQVATQSIVFFDDNPVECAEMRAALPAVRTLQIPSKDQLPNFVSHCWLLDRRPETKADHQRAESYRAEGAREAEREKATSLSEFFAGLGLNISIAEPAADDLPRIEQMSRRTTQFNINPRSILAADVASCDIFRIVSVSDKFGDYGVVGAVGGKVETTHLTVPIFLLSCRALGRGVEHTIIRALAAWAADRGCLDIAFDSTVTDRNYPARQFLTDIGASPTLDIAKAQSVYFDPEATRAQADQVPVPRRQARDTPSTMFDTTIYERIATSLLSADTIVDAMGGSLRERPEAAGPYIAPQKPEDVLLTGLWQDVLRIAPVGLSDHFQSLGGTSLQLVDLHTRICREFGRAVELMDLFRAATLKEMVELITQKDDAKSGLSNRAQTISERTRSIGHRRRTGRERGQ